MQKDRILYICDNFLGDVLVTLDQIAELKRRMPNSSLCVFVHKGLADLLKTQPFIDSLVVGDVQTPPLSQLSCHFQIVVNSRLDHHSYTLIKKLDYSKACGIECADIDRLKCCEIYTHWIPLEVWTDEFKSQSVCRTLGTLIQLLFHDYIGVPPYLAIKRESSEEAEAIAVNSGWNRPIMLFPGANSEYKRWPFENFMQLAEILTHCAPIVFVFGPSEKKMVAQHKRCILEKGFHILESANLPLLAALYQRAQLNITNDTGPMHLACSVRCPTVAIFGSTVASVWFPYDRAIHRVIENSCAQLSSCQDCDKRRTCIQEISVDIVAIAAWELLSTKQNSTHCSHIGN